jgi:hypothetical protein
MTIDRNHLHTIADQDGGAILDIERGMITTLNPTGAFVWQRLQRGEVLETIVANLAYETGEDAAIVERDVHKFAEILKENHLLSR